MSQRQKMTEDDIERLAFQAVKTSDYAEARRLLEPLTERDSEYALMTLGWMHEAGKGAPRKMKLAASLYERATQIGCLEGYNSLGRVLREEGDPEKAREAFAKGAELGNLGSIGWLGIMMLSGQGGPIDVENGRIWLNRAAEMGHVAANGKLLIIEKQNSKSVFRHVTYHIKKMLLTYRALRQYSNDPYSGKLF